MLVFLIFCKEKIDTRVGLCYNHSCCKAKNFTRVAAKKALEVAAAGGYNIIMVSPPGAGKSMLAKRLTRILPQMTFEESIETTKIHPIAGTHDSKIPFWTNCL